MSAYYNEFDPAAAHVLRHMSDANVIAPGVVDPRSIKEVTPDDIRDYTQCHFFGGGGLWSVALRAAGWADDRRIWTASCPCQPFSAAGKGQGTDDPRHLWPDLFRLVRAARPPVIVGEQVAGKAGYGWFDGIRADLEGEGYACRAVDIPACSVDAPHQRNRLYWIAVANNASTQRGTGLCETQTQQNGNLFADGDGACGYVGDTIDAGLERQCRYGHEGGGSEQNRSIAATDGGSYWSDAEWITCHDGKQRRTQPDIRFLVDGLPGRVDLWRIGGNAIVPQAAQAVIEALIETIG